MRLTLASTATVTSTAAVTPPPPRPTPAPVRKTVLLVAADAQLRELLSLQLRAAGCFPMTAAHAAEARRLATQVVPDLVLLDTDGVDAADIAWATTLLQADGTRPVPAALLGSNGLQAVPPAGPAAPALLLRVAKPLEMAGLMRQLLRLLRPPPDAAGLRSRQRLRAGALEVDRQRPVLRLRRAEGWAEVDLPWTEHRLLACLLGEAGRACSRADIRDAVWRDGDVNLRTVDQYVRRLRRSLARAGAPGLVKTVNGLGYRLDLAALALPAA
ncbi:MAG: winged helix-turn-helix domain-containing protein [Rubrivivax sp.]|nr:winged helix-turn-helix domain-containing protein [Rubrivivax sp.]